jgi:hypothetical protein
LAEPLVLVAVLPMLEMALPLTVAVRFTVAAAVLVLNELVKLLVDVEPLLAAEVPVPAAEAVPELSRLLPVLLLLF